MIIYLPYHFKFFCPVEEHICPDLVSVTCLVCNELHVYPIYMSILSTPDMRYFKSLSNCFLFLFCKHFSSDISHYIFIKLCFSPIKPSKKPTT